MQSHRFFVAAAASLVLFTVSANAARVDMNDPRRALGREDDVRVDAQLLQETLSPSAVIGVTYQIQNLSGAAVAVADKTVDISYDSDAGVVSISIGAEVPTGAAMPHLVVIGAGEKRVFTTGGVLRAAVPNVRTPWTVVPRAVQIKVCLLRDLAPFAELIEAQKRTPAAPLLPDSMFDRWVESTDSLFLNPIPVRWKSEPHRGIAESSQPPDLRGGNF